MDFTLRFLNNKTVFQQTRMCSVLLSLTLAACAPSSGGGGSNSTLVGGLTCPVKIQSLAQNDVNSASNVEESSAPNINLDPQYENYIVEFDDEETEANVVLEPSGNPVHEYDVEGVKISKINGKTYSLNLRNTSGASAEEAIARLSKRRRIKFVEPDYPVSLDEDIQTEELENDDMVGQASLQTQWALQTIQADKAWQITRGAEDIVVAVVDSGIDYTHKDLKNNIWTNPREVLNGKDDDGNGYVDDIRGWNYVANNNDPKTTSQSNHGTHVAGIIGAAGQVLGGAQKVKLMPLRFISESGSGSTSAAIRAIDYAVSKGVFAINNSWGSSKRSQALQDAINRAERAGVLFLAAAGNGRNGVGYDIGQEGYYPGGYANSNIITVAASRTNDSLTAFSNFSSSIVEVAAPGSSILSTVTGDKYMKMSGTSMATPLVTGLAVLVKAANRRLNASQIRAVISSTVDAVDSLKGKVSSGGRVNARKAVQMAAQVTSDFTCP